MARQEIEIKIEWGANYIPESNQVTSQLIFLRWRKPFCDFGKLTVSFKSKNGTTKMSPANGNFVLRGNAINGAELAKVLGRNLTKSDNMKLSNVWPI